MQKKGVRVCVFFFFFFFFFFFRNNENRIQMGTCIDRKSTPMPMNVKSWLF
jgi:hypothetical protein